MILYCKSEDLIYTIYIELYYRRLKFYFIIISYIYKKKTNIVDVVKTIV